jgi:hypothetical protein
VSEGAEQPWRRGGPSLLLGRALPAAFTAILAFLTIGDAVTGGVHGWEAPVAGVLLVVAALTVALAWLEAGLGAMLLLLIGAAFFVFGAITANRDPVFVAVLLGAPYALGAALISYGLGRRRVE